MKQLIAVLLLFFVFSFCGITQRKHGNFLVNDKYKAKVILLDTGYKCSLRGLSVLNDSVFYTSGSNGTVVKSTDGGKTLEWLKVKGFEKTDFRDIEVIDEHTAIIMGITLPAVMLKTVDGGKNWRTVFKDTAANMFLDAMSFYDNNKGIALGDPINNQFYLATTSDGGDTWQPLSIDKRPTALQGEACFASSGSNIILQKSGRFLFVTGGLKARLWNGNNWQSLAITQGQESTGANSISMNLQNKTLAIVGGDFTQKNKRDSSLLLINKMLDFTIPLQCNGYRSSVCFYNSNTIFSCGLNGVDMNNELISTIGFHAIQKAKNGTTVYMVGGNGKIGKLQLNKQ